jgi:hypothetical protein
MLLFIPVSETKLWQLLEVKGKGSVVLPLERTEINPFKASGKNVYRML